MQNSSSIFYSLQVFLCFLLFFISPLHAVTCYLEQFFAVTYVQISRKSAVYNLLVTAYTLLNDECYCIISRHESHL